MDEKTTGVVGHEHHFVPTKWMSNAISDERAKRLGLPTKAKWTPYRVCDEPDCNAATVSAVLDHMTGGAVYDEAVAKGLKSAQGGQFPEIIVDLAILNEVASTETG